MRHTRLAIAGTVAAVLAAGAHAQTTINLTSSHDNTIYENPDTDVSNGAGGVMFTGRPNSGLIHRALLSFDLSSIPTGATITSATLRLNMSRTTHGTPTPFSLFRVLAAWGEGASVGTIGGGGAGAQAMQGDCTWLYRFYNAANPPASPAWTTPGGDFAAVASATTNVAGVAAYTWSSAGLIADLQAWLANPSSNFGWALIGGEGSAGTSRRFDTRENATANNRPRLTITYIIPTPSTAAPLAAVGLVALRRRRCEGAQR